MTTHDLVTRLGFSDAETADRSIAEFLGVHPLAVWSARRVVADVLVSGADLSNSAVEEELAKRPGLVEPMPKVCRYLVHRLTEESPSASEGTQTEFDNPDRH